MTSARTSASSFTILGHQPCVVPRSLAGSAGFISAIISSCVKPGPVLISTVRKALRAASYLSAARGQVLSGALMFSVCMMRLASFAALARVLLFAGTLGLRACRLSLPALWPQDSPGSFSACPENQSGAQVEAES